MVFFMLNNNTKLIKIGFILLVGLATGYILCLSINKDKLRIGDRFSEFIDVEKALGKNVYKTNDEIYAVQEAINGYYRGLGDKYFSYEKSGTIKSTEDNINNSNMLLQNGFEIRVNSDRNILITRVDRNSYAEKMGLQKYDIITRIDGTSVSENGFQKTAKKILGKSGSSSIFTILRHGQEITIEYTRLHAKNEKNFYKIIDNTCYISYDYFNSGTAGIFTDAYTECYNEVDGYIVDLRNNPGGLTDVALDIIGDFIGEKQIVNFHYINGKEEKFFSTGEKIYNKSIIILMNRYTASSSEILISALKQFYDCEIITIGENTLGKGTFQYDKFTDDYDVIKSTEGYYTVGDWDCYQDIGISPDIEIIMDISLIGTDDDIQLQKALELLS